MGTAYPRNHVLGNQKDPRVGRRIKKIASSRAVQIFVVSSSKLMRSKIEVVVISKACHYFSAVYFFASRFLNTVFFDYH